MKSQYTLLLIVLTSTTILNGCTSPIMENYYKVRCWERNVCDGDEAFRQRDFAASVHEFDLALNYADNDARQLATKIRLANALTNAGDLSRAVPLLDALKKAYIASGDKLHSLEVVLLLGNCHMQSKDWSGAKKFYQEALERSRDLEGDGLWSVRATHNQIKSLTALSAIAREQLDATASSDYESQAQELRMRKTNQDDVVGLERILEKAARASDRNDSETVISLLEPYARRPELQKNTASFGRMMLALSKAYLNNNEPEKCFDTYERWLTVVDADPFHKREDLFRIYGRFGHALQKQAQWDRAIEMLKASRELMPEEPSEKSAAVFLDLAFCYRHKYDHEHAQAALDAAQKMNAILKLKNLEAEIDGEQRKLSRLPVHQ